MLTRFATISGGGDRHGEPLNLSSVPTATANEHGHRFSAPRIENDSRDAIHCVYTVYNGRSLWHAAKTLVDGGSGAAMSP